MGNGREKPGVAFQFSIFAIFVQIVRLSCSDVVSTFLQGVECFDFGFEPLLDLLESHCVVGERTRFFTSIQKPK